MDPNGWFQQGISPNATDIPLYLLYIYVYTRIYPQNPIPIRCLVSYPIGPSASHDPSDRASRPKMEASRLRIAGEGHRICSREDSCGGGLYNMMSMIGLLMLDRYIMDFFRWDNWDMDYVDRIYIYMMDIIMMSTYLRGMIAALLSIHTVWEYLKLHVTPFVRTWETGCP